MSRGSSFDSRRVSRWLSTGTPVISSSFDYSAHAIKYPESDKYRSINMPFDKAGIDTMSEHYGDIEGSEVAYLELADGGMQVQSTLGVGIG